ncbi:PD-(D/E)XK nuclease family protein [Paraburkholderia kirstenboschensis]|uniref:PD-(D/E)XK nuclease family protein n=1 Tax=Paraburkholderia kirstenboschensis TaxID=1245436 RepID=UPI0037420047
MRYDSRSAARPVGDDFGRDIKTNTRDASVRPNLFKYATSELSQDAFICWLLEAADSKYESVCPELCALGRAFLSLIFAGHTDAPAPARIETVEIQRQKARIDILCWVNRDIVIVIEDKVGTEQSRGQLRRYKDHAETGLKQPISRRLHTYIQTGDQSNYSPVLLDGYSILRRSDLLELFESELGKARARPVISLTISRADCGTLRIRYRVTNPHRLRNGVEKQESVSCRD